eukprot:299597-Chlamydomonas_euryale.AAC.1
MSVSVGSHVSASQNLPGSCPGRCRAPSVATRGTSGWPLRGRGGVADPGRWSPLSCCCPAAAAPPDRLRVRGAVAALCGRDRSNDDACCASLQLPPPPPPLSTASSREGCRAPRLPRADALYSTLRYRSRWRSALDCCVSYIGSGTGADARVAGSGGATCAAPMARLLPLPPPLLLPLLPALSVACGSEKLESDGCECSAGDASSLPPLSP